MVSFINYILSILFLVSPVLNTCNSEDEMPPVIENVTLNDKQGNIEIPAPDTLKFEAKFTDDINLTDYQLVITPDFQISMQGRVSIFPFDFEKFYNLGGTSTLAHSLIPIPRSAAEGNYTLRVNFEDKAGNQGGVVERSFKITNSAPLINLKHPEKEDIALAPEDTLQIKGTVKSFGANIRRMDFIMNKGPDNPVFADSITTATGEISGQFHQFELQHPMAQIDTGQYNLMVKALDQNGKFSGIPTNIFILN